MKNLLFVGFGGFVGAMMRYQTGAWIMHASPNSRFPWATMIVNIVGCFAIGLIAALLERIQFHNSELRLLVITGLLGGFTTFSAFGLETLFLIRQSLYLFAAANVVVSVLVGLLATYAGLRCGPYLSTLLS